jgi:drug/metabolite transporter (DMT)-like permease
VNERRIAIRLMIAQGVLFAAETAAIHHIGTGASVMQLALIRSAAGVLLAFALGRNAAGGVLRTRQLPLQLVRGGVTLLYMWVMIYSFAAMPFSDATAISYTQTGYIAVFSVLILGETVGGARWGAAAIGLLGALLIAKPAFAGWNSVYLVALVGTSLNGLAFVLNRYLQRQDSVATTMFYTNFVPLLGNFPIIFLLGLPDTAVLVWLPGIFLLGPLGMFAGIMAVRRANAATLGPYTLLQLVIAVIGGAVIFHELPDICSVLGTVLIVMSCIISSAAGFIRLPSGCLSRSEWRDVALPRSEHTQAPVR